MQAPGQHKQLKLRQGLFCSGPAQPRNQTLPSAASTGTLQAETGLSSGQQLREAGQQWLSSAADTGTQ